MKNLVPAKKRPDWRRLSKEWERSGQTQKDFCAERCLSYFQFCRKRVELKKQGPSTGLYSTAPQPKKADEFIPQPVPVQPKMVGQFIPVTVEAEEPTRATRQTSASPVPEVEMELPFGIILRIRGMAQQ